MALGLKYGRSAADDIAAREKTSELIKEFDRRFLKTHCGLQCCELLQKDVSIPEKREQLLQEKAFERICPGLVKDAAEIVENLLQMNPVKEL